MAEKSKTCQVVMYEADVCGRQVYDDKGMCICHSEREDKDAVLFDEEIQKIFEDVKAEVFDFTKFVFHKECRSFMEKRFEKDAIFNRSKFLGVANIFAAQFSGQASFIELQFLGEVIFSYAEFSGEAEFIRAEFSGETDFSSAQFAGDAHFNLARFSGDADFSSAQFSGSAYFNLARFSGDANYFEAQFLSEADYFEAKFSGKACFNTAKFKGDANFKLSEFSNQAHFIEVEFLSVANFHSAKFLNEAQFGSSKFVGTTNFNGALFSGLAFFGFGKFSCGVDFSLVKFLGEIYFEDMEFEKEASFYFSAAKSKATIAFDGEKLSQNQIWKNGADFINFIVEKDAVVTFRKVSMKGVQLLESNISRMEFIDVKWPRTSRWHQRRTVADEIVEGEKDYSLIAQVYQGLQENYANWYRYLEAGDFFVGEQEMRRKGKGKWGQYFSLNNAYRILSYYGQSMLLPLFWLLGVISIVPGLLMYGGVGINLQDKSDIVNYEWSFNISHFLLLKADYWQTFLFNFSFMAFSRSKMHDALTEPWQLALVNFEALVVIGLVAMSLLAVRRRFKRKNF